MPAAGGSAGPALIPLQLQQTAAAPGGSLPVSPYPHTTSTFSTVTIPSSLKLDSVKGGMAALQTPPPGTPNKISGTQTFNPPSLDGLMKPQATLIYNGGHGQQPSEAGPIRTHTRQAAKERPSPVVFDGERKRERERERACSYGLYISECLLSLSLLVSTATITFPGTFPRFSMCTYN